jgi:hypothetical protein
MASIGRSTFFERINGTGRAYAEEGEKEVAHRMGQIARDPPIGIPSI